MRPGAAGDRRGERDEWRRDKGQQNVLDHVDREQARVVAVDPGQQREGQRGHRPRRRRGSAARHRVGRMCRVHPADSPTPPDQRGEDPDRRQRLERPAEEERGGVRWFGRGSGRAPPQASRSAQSPRRPPGTASDLERWLERGARNRSVVHRRHGPTTPRPVGRTRRRPSAVSWPPSGPGRVRTCPSAPAPRTCMASSPQDRPPSAAIAALLVGALLIVGVAAGGGHQPGARPAEASSEPSTSPPPAITDRGAQIRNLYDIIFGIAAVDLLRRRRADHLDGRSAIGASRPTPSCPPRRTATRSPRWCGRSFRPSSSPSCSSSPGRRCRPSRRSRRNHRSRSAPSRLSSCGRSITCRPTTRRQQRGHAAHPDHAGRDRGRQGGLVLPTGRTVHLYLQSPDVIHAFYVPAVPVQARRRPGPREQLRVHAQRGRCRWHVPRAMRRAVRRQPQRDAVRRPRDDRRRVRRLAWREDRPRRTPRPPPPAVGRAVGPPAPRPAIAAQNVQFDTASSERAGRRALQDRVRQPGCLDPS